MTESSPLVSVCIQTYQHVNYIKECLDSILNQKTNFTFEILLGEDCSTDGTREICIEYSKIYLDKIRLFLHTRETVIYINGNATGRYNFFNNIKNAKGKYIALCDGDDYWSDSNKLQKQIDFLETHPEYALCWTRFKLLNNKKLSIDNNGHYFQNDDGIEFDFEKFTKGWHIGMQTLVYRKSAIQKNNNFDNKYYRDVFLISDLLASGKGYCLNQFTAVYRQHSGGVYTSTSEMERAKTSSHIYKEIYKAYKDNSWLALKYQKFNDRYIRLLINNKQIVEALSEINEYISFVSQPDEHYKSLLKYIETILAEQNNKYERVDRQLKQKSDQLKHIQNSISFKFGRLITFPARAPLELKRILCNFISELPTQTNINRRELKKKGVNFIDKKKIVKDSKKLIPLSEKRTDRNPKLIVSLTSFPERIPDLFYGLYSLLNQSIAPDYLILWLAEEQFPNKENDLPKNILNLKNYGLTIRWCKDIKSYKKLIYALQDYPDAIIVTADDDLYYPENWLELLYQSYLKEPQYIHCHRAHKINFINHNLAPYDTWEKCISTNEISYNNFFTTGGGVLSPPNCFYADVLNEELFMKLCPNADDIWFWAMSVLNNTKIKVIQNNITELIHTNPEVEYGLKPGLTLGRNNVLEQQNDYQLKSITQKYNNILNKLHKNI